MVLRVVQAAENCCQAAMLNLHLSPCQFPVARKCGGGWQGARVSSELASKHQGSFLPPRRKEFGLCRSLLDAH